MSESATALLANVLQVMMQAISSNPEVIQCPPGRTPLMVIHDGTAFAFYSLRNLDRAVIGVHCPRGQRHCQSSACKYAAIARQYLKAEQPSTFTAPNWWMVSRRTYINNDDCNVSRSCVWGGDYWYNTSWSRGRDSSTSGVRTDDIHGLVRWQRQLNTRALFSNPEYKTTLRVSALKFLYSLPPLWILSDLRNHFSSRTSAPSSC
jgi:hypothetical protein